MRCIKMTSFMNDSLKKDLKFNDKSIKKAFSVDFRISCHDALKIPWYGSISPTCLRPFFSGPKSA